MGLNDFIDEVNKVDTGKAQFHMRVYFQSEYYYLVLKRLNVERLFITKDILTIILVDGRVWELKITEDLTFWSESDLKPEE